jgi:hypothetical protein
MPPVFVRMFKTSVATARRKTAQAKIMMGKGAG